MPAGTEKRTRGERQSHDRHATTGAERFRGRPRLCGRLPRRVRGRRYARRSPECSEGSFSELRPNGVLRSSSYVRRGLGESLRALWSFLPASESLALGPPRERARGPSRMSPRTLRSVPEPPKHHPGDPLARSPPWARVPRSRSRGTRGPSPARCASAGGPAGPCGAPRYPRLESIPYRRNRRLLSCPNHRSAWKGSSPKLA
jgi:hypothetical protein